ncbi:MAG: thioredoxin domain-containing protein [Thermoanaerobaculia bacterium]
MTESLLSLRPVRRAGSLAAWAALGWFGCVLPACAGDSNAAAKPDVNDKNAVVAEVQGQKITMADVEKAAAAQLAQIEKQRFAVIQQTVDRLVEDKLVDAEAAARGVDKQSLLKTEIQDKVSDISDAEVDTWFQQNQARLGGRTKESIAPQIKQFLSQQKQNDVREAFLGGLRAKYTAKVLIEPPRMVVAEADSPAKGPANAPVVLIEFSDFQCPYCSRVAPDLHKAIDTYGDKLRVVFRQFPLNIHPMAPKAAEAALCAHEQGKFWEMHDAMFANQQKLQVDDLKATAKGLGINAEQFNACLDGSKFKSKVDADVADGSKVGVTGTPAMFVNGIAISGAVPFAELAKTIDAELARKGVAPAKSASK